MNPYKSNASILIVDDEPNNLKVLHNLLTQNDYDVRAARDGKTAIEAAKATQPDLILMDIKMPSMTGYEACEILKQDEDLADIPVIFISALNNVNDIVKAFQVGGVDYVTKPFQFEEVLARVHNHLTIVYQQRQLRHNTTRSRGCANVTKSALTKLAKYVNNSFKRLPMTLKIPLAIVMGLC